MAGLDPAIYALLLVDKDVDARDRPGHDDMVTSGLLIPQLPFVRRIVRLIDRKLVHGRLPEMFREPRRLQINLAVCYLFRQRAIQFNQRTIRAKQLLEPRGLRGITPLLQRLAEGELQDLPGGWSVRTRSGTSRVCRVLESVPTPRAEDVRPAARS